MFVVDDGEDSVATAVDSARGTLVLAETALNFPVFNVVVVTVVSARGDSDGCRNI